MNNLYRNQPIQHPARHHLMVQEIDDISCDESGNDRTLAHAFDSLSKCQRSNDRYQYQGDIKPHLHIAELLVQAA